LPLEDNKGIKRNKKKQRKGKENRKKKTEKAPLLH
jgi:hypothetical protein